VHDQVPSDGLPMTFLEFASSDGRQVRRASWYLRVIYRIDDKVRVVTVVDVAHRRDVNRT
jgi:mRNA-degrading endonuclease RelE of RelBE toxin-antitoxin system